ncbi:magnesium transporter MRS2-B [Artemisia annua]|uniref:Magnesium transporter n=1 Tax=Artemisia annua TaxID=35608 RepID=A0A2U1PR13_ARTAN|nr:magnesium transporter MRS2-B [Artemisia annua]
MEDLKERLLPMKASSVVINPRDVLNLKKRGQGLRSYIRLDAATGDSQVIEVDKFTMMRHCDLPAHDLRLLDPLFVYPSTILGRETAIDVNLEQIRCIITSDEVLLLNSLDSYVLQYVVELKRRLKGDVWQSDSSNFNRRRGGMFGNTSPDYLSFEFKALEVALEAACTFLDAQVAELEIEVYPLFRCSSTISSSNLECVRRLKSRLVALTRRVQKKIRTESLFNGGDQSLAGCRSTDGIQSVSAPISPVCSPPPSGRRFDRNLSLARSRIESTKSSESGTENIDELEMLLEAYFVVTDATFVVAIFGVVAGIFGMNFEISLFQNPLAFKWKTYAIVDAKQTMNCESMGDFTDMMQMLRIVTLK